MGYMDGGVRVIGAHPRHAALLYNLGCNGVGFLPSICGGERDRAACWPASGCRRASSTRAESPGSGVQSERPVPNWRSPASPRPGWM